MHAWPLGGVRMGLHSTCTSPPLPGSIQLIAKQLDTEGNAKAGEGNRLARDKCRGARPKGAPGPETLAHLRPWDRAVGTAYPSSQLRGRDPWAQQLGSASFQAGSPGHAARSHAMTFLSAPGPSTS